MRKKMLMLLAAVALFSCAGVLYYKVEVDDKEVMFPIDMNDKEDVGTATFEAEYKPLTLMRYIRKAIDKDLLIVMPKK